MRVRVVLILATVLAVATAAGYVASERVRALRSRDETAVPVGAATVAAGPAATAAAGPAPDAVALRAPADPSPPAPGAVSPRAATTPASDPVVARARRLAAREPYAREDLRRLFEQVLAGKLRDRELGSEDYDRLVDAALRLRAALRVLRGTEESAATAAVRDEQRRAVGAILGEIEAITGLPPAELDSVLTPKENESGGESAGRADE